MNMSGLMAAVCNVNKGKFTQKCLIYVFKECLNTCKSQTRIKCAQTASKPLAVQLVFNETSGQTKACLVSAVAAQ